MRRSSTASAELGGFAVHLVPDLHHEGGAVVAHDLLQIGLTEHPAQRRIQDRRQLVVGPLDGPTVWIEFERIDDVIAHEGVDQNALVIRRQNLLLRRFQIENAVVEIDDGLDEGDLGLQPGLVITLTGSPKMRTSACCVCATVKNVPLRSSDDDHDGREGRDDARSHGLAPDPVAGPAGSRR